jgi:predicted transcriptional regulator
MAKKTLTLQIKSSAEALQDFKNTFTKVAAGRRVQRREGVYFTSIEAARNLLTRNRLGLLRAIRQLHPRSTYELAQRVGRDIKNVQDDLRLLEEYGLVRLAAGTGAGRRRAKVPEVLFGEIALKIAI